MKPFVLGIDVGGTNVKLGIVSASGNVLYRSQLATKSLNCQPGIFAQHLIVGIFSLLENSGVASSRLSGIGIGLPGSVDYPKGKVHYLTNIFGWREVPLRNMIQSRIKLPVFIDNDVHVFTLGEWKFGAGRGAKDMVGIALGTGVGGGLILNGSLYRGNEFAAGEIGHMPINEKGPSCNCGGWGCLESYVGTQALINRTRVLFKNKKITLEELTKLASGGHAKALKFWEETAFHLANGLVAVINLLNPNRIVIGGGVANAYPFLATTLKRVIASRAMKTQREHVKILKSKLGPDAGIIGAKVLVEEALKSGRCR